MRILHLHFAQPLWLAVGLLTVLALLALSVNRGTKVETAYLDLWERAVAETPFAERLLQRLSNVLVALLCAACLLASVAAAGPSREIPGPRDVVFVLDQSATMSTVSGGVSRLGEGKQWIGRQVKELADFDRAGLATVGLDARLLVKPTTDRAEFRARLAEVSVEPAHADLSSAGELDFGPMGTSTPGKGSHMRLETVLVSDGSGGKRPFVKTKVVGVPEPNCGIVGLRVRDPFPEKEAELDLTIVNGGSESATRRVAATRDGKELAAADVTVPARSETLTTLRVPRGDGGIGTVGLTPRDAFELDDEATFLLTPPAKAPLVLVKTADGPSAAFEAAAHALAQEFDVPLGEMSSPGKFPENAVVLQEGGTLDTIPARALVFGTSVPGLASPAGPPAAPRPILTFRGGHPLLRGLRFDRLFARRQVKFEGSFEDLARAEDGPFLVLSTGTGEASDPPRRIAAFAFSLDHSNFVSLDGALPVFLRRAFLWLSGGDRSILGSTRTGDDPMGALVGRPIRGPRKLGLWALPSNAETTASLLDRAAVDVTPQGSKADPVLAQGAPSAEAIGAYFAWSAVIFFAAAVALELLTFLRESGATLPRRARAL